MLLVFCCLFSLVLAVAGLFYGLFAMVDINSGKMKKPNPERLKNAWAIAMAGLVLSTIFLMMFYLVCVVVWK